MTVGRDRFYWRRVKLLIEQRDEIWVDPDDADARFVEIVPREHWAKIMGETATDFGFLKVDPQRTAIYYEGDRRRMCIPTETMTACVGEPIIDFQGKAQHYAAVVSASDGLTDVELPFIVLGPPWASGRNRSRRRVEELLARMAVTAQPAGDDDAPTNAPTDL
jgi:hypothetical protein